MSQIKWNVCFDRLDDRKILEDFLPKDAKYSYEIDKYVLLEKDDIRYESKFEADLSVNVCSVKEFETFTQEFEKISNTSYNKTGYHHKNRGNVVQSGKLKCHHNVSKRRSSQTQGTPKDKSENKNTHCPAHIKYSLKKADNDHNHDQTVPCSNFNLKISLSFNHNHDILTARAQSFLKVGDEARKIYRDLYEEGDTPGSAYQHFQERLKQKYGDDKYLSVSANRGLNPEYAWVFYQYREYTKASFGSIQSPDTFEKTNELINNYNKAQGRKSAVLKQFESGDYYISVVDSFARRVHAMLPACGDIALVDASSNIDRSDAKLFNFVVPSAVGGLRIGYCIVSTEREDLLTECFTAFRDLLDQDKAFFNRGAKLGPKAFLSDDGTAMINALNNVWPESDHLLCQWHVLTALWRYIGNANNGIKKADRPYLLRSFKKLCYTETKIQYEKAKESFLNDKLIKKHPKFVEHVTKLYLSRPEKWAKFARFEQGMSLHGAQTSNYVEVSLNLDI